ncbi:MFS transporter [Nocardioides seonyuensis]|uniref:MFS transporter n=1 Tax=Nocardioides seonyuensis TaxID=2518371 RepID=A0A4V1BMD3_9ACTN|nr:MFS transporter [Nocardioides seonyuensis]QBX55972.1 MFS transporter [Nocardioides seonyuensis]
MTSPTSPRRGLFATLALLTTITALTGSLGAPLVPGIATEHDVPLEDAQWSLTLTLLVGAASTPVLGRLSGGRHRNAVVAATLAAVLLGTLLCTVDVGFAAFLTGRGLQGLGYGLTPVAIAIARTSLPAERRAAAISILSVTTVAGAGLGYPVSAGLAQAWGLSAAFAVGAVLVAATLAACVVTLPPSPGTTHVPVDWRGTVLLAGGTTAALLALAQLTAAPPLLTAALLLVAVIGWTLWVHGSRRRPHPIVDLALAVRPVPLLAHATSFLIGVGVYLLLPLVVVVVQAPWGLDRGAAVSGLLLVPYSLISVAGSRLGLRLGPVVGRFMLLPLGCSTYFLAFVSMTLWHDTVWQLVGAMVLAGLGSGLALAAIPGLLVVSVPAAETGSAVAFNMLLRYLGFSLGSTLGLFVLTFDGEPTGASFDRAMLASCLVAGFTLVVSLLYAVRATRFRW